jgi:hypothetical protein
MGARPGAPGCDLSHDLGRGGHYGMAKFSFLGPDKGLYL